VSEPTFRELFARANIGMVVTNLDGRFVAVNPAFCEMVGYTEAELLETGFLAVTHPDDRAASREAFDGVLAGDVSASTIEKRYISRDGRMIWANVVISCIRDDDGRPLHAMATIEDTTARQSAEEELQRSRALQRVAGRLACVGGWTLEVPAMRFLVSDELQAILKDAASVPLEDGLERVPEPYRERVASAIRACATEGTAFDLEVPIIDRDGSEIMTRLVAEAQRNEDGTISRVVGANQDIRELRRATEEARELAQWLTTTVESLTDAFCALDTNWSYTYVNRAAEEILGRPRQTLLGRVLWEEYPELVGTEVEAAYHRAMNEGTTEVIEAFLNPALDQWFSLRAYPSTAGLAVLFHDVTDQHRMMEALRHSQARLAEQAALLDEARDAIVVRDLGHRVTYWNRSAERTFGWTAEEVIGRSIRELLFPSSAAFDDAAKRLLADGEWYGELTATTRAGRELVLECREILLRDDAGHPRSVLAIKTDITERKRLDVQHRRTQRMESLGTLAGGLAHDLNNALTPVRMATELLQSQETDPSRLSMLDTVASGTQRATDMVRQILSFAAGAEGRRVSVDVGALLREVERFANDTFLKTIRLVREDPTDLLAVVGDPTQLNQVLINLCVNARDAMPQGGTLVLAAEVVDDPPGDGLPPGRYVRIRVEDDGQGMAPEILDHIFEPFYTTKEHGTGLGLSTSAGIITSHGGSMSVESKPGEGTRFVVHLPVAAGARSPGPAPETSIRPKGHGELVLVVDDEDDIRTILRNVLTSSGYRVLEAADGAGAVAVLSRAGNTVDLVVTDMRMPGMDGLETIRALRGVRPDVPIVLISGLHTQTLSDEAAELGVRHVLAKPFSSALLLQSLGDILNRA
jgi:PAS domain S-box-containing protein